MATVRYSLLIFVIIINSTYSMTVPNKEDLFIINVTMTNYQTTHDDQYAYMQYKLPDEELTIVGYSPLIDMNSAHHMLTYACEKPGSKKQFWTSGATCDGEQMIIHGWARNAPAMNLPEDVGFLVGRNTPYKYIVVNIHYFSKLTNDNSGNQLIMSRTPRKYRAGVMLSGTSDIYLRPKSETIRTPFSCEYNGPPISIFAVRVHAHQWARVNSLYRVRDGAISQIAKGDPQWPQSFYPLTSPVKIENGDFIIGQCVYDNNEDRVIQVGSTHNDEMCNVYAMYSYKPSRKSSESQPTEMCWGNQFNKMASLIPLDSVVPPIKPADMGETKGSHHAHAEHAMISSQANLYTNVENWPDMKSLPTKLGEIGGIALSNANTELIVFHRGSRKWEFKYFNNYRFRNEKFGPIDENVLIHIDTRTGETKYQWGAKMFYMPHGLTIDHEGNFWVTDIAMHQVFMFKPSELTHPALTVGELFQPGSGPSQLCRPTDVAVMKNGDFFIADGYCNSRIVKFNRKGEYLMEWGSPMSGKRDNDGFPIPNEWNIVHSIALNEDAQLVCGADRENFRIQCFNSNTGEFQRQIRVESNSTIGAIYAIEFVPNANGTVLFAVTGGIQTEKKKVYMIDAQTGDILTSFDSNPPLNSPHDITVSSNAREIYVGELALTPVNALHKFEISKRKDLPTQTYSRRNYFTDKNFRISIIIMIAFAFPVLIAVIVGCCIRIKNMRKLNRLNTFLNEMKTGGTNRSSVLGDWMNRRKGFELLDQYSDGENEPLDSNIGNDSNDNSGDETITITNKPQGIISNNKKQNTNVFKMGESL